MYRDYGDEDDLTVDDLRDDLRDADFDGDAADAFAEAIGGDQNLAASRDALRQAQRQAAESLRDGGAIGDEVVRGRDPNGNRQYTIGSVENVEQDIRRTGPTSGEVIARNTNTGTEGVIGEVELPRQPTEP